MKRIAIVGGGCSGVAALAHLYDTCGPACRIDLIDPSSRLGRGLAYSTVSPDHLLNVPAGRMSILADIPDHFSAFCRRRGIASPDHSFLPRALYGDYLESVLQTCLHRFAQTRIHQAEAVSLVPRMSGGYALTLSTREELVADAVVLALGNMRRPMMLDGADLVRQVDPYRESLPADLPSESAALVIGSGLTALDYIMSLAHDTRVAKIVVVSRSGRFPQAHPAHIQRPWEFSGALPHSLPQLCRFLRREIRAAADAGTSWHAVLDALRPHTRGLWSGLPLSQKRSFLRHAQSLWNSHRHRSAAGPLKILESLQSDGRLEVVRGEVQRFAKSGENVLAFVTDRNTQSVRAIPVQLAAHAAGLEDRIECLPSPLLRRLLDSGVVSPDELGLGIRINNRHQVIRSDERVERGLFALGSLCRGTLWETTAVPEIRTQARIIAGHAATAVTVSRSSGTVSGLQHWGASGVEVV